MPEVEYKWNDTEVDIVIADKKQNYTVNKKIMTAQQNN